MKRIENPKNPFHKEYLELFDAEPAKVELFEEQVKSIVTENSSPDIPFRYSVNPYRGCFHACAYCYARPTHQYLDFGAGSDFERKLTVKVNAAQKLKERFDAPSWKGECLVFSGVTDCYQPHEAVYELTRECLKVCVAYRNPVLIITKAALIERDIDVLQQLAEVAAVQVYFSIPFQRDDIAKALEPSAPRSSRRFRAMQCLAEAGISVGLSLSPLIPGLNESDIPQLIERANVAGATRAFMTLLRLPAQVQEVFCQRLEEALPERAQKILHAIPQYRSGAMNSSRFGQRMKGEGQRWHAAKWLFEQSCQRFGLNALEERAVSEQVREEGLARQSFRRPTPQLTLPGFS